MKCVERISTILKEDWILKIGKEFEERKTKEAIFVYKMDKLQALIQAKYYSEKINDHNEIFNEFCKNSLHLCGEFSEIVENN